MLRVNALFFPFLLAVLLSSPVAAHQLTWLVADAPPLYIDQGFYAGQGYWQQGLEQLNDELSQYEIKKYQATLSRQYALLQEEDEFCAAGFFKTAERQQFLLYSLPLLHAENAVVAMRKNLAQKLGEGAVSLTEMLQKNYLFGVSSGRSYGTIVDTLFRQNRTDKNVFEYEGESLSLGFLEMLSRGRIDALVLPPTDYFYNVKLLAIEEQVVARPIAELMDQDIDEHTTYIVCSKSRWGEEAIASINSIVRRGSFRQELAGAYGAWLPVELRKTYFKKLERFPWYSAALFQKE